MLAVYSPRLPGTECIPLLYPNLGASGTSSLLFSAKAFAYLKEPLVQLVEDPAQAGVLLVAHNFPSIRRNNEYLRQFADLSIRLNKKIVVFWHGDSDEPVDLPNAIVFRTSQYRSAKKPNEIMMPAYAEDLLADQPLVIRSKPEQLVVGFCGWAEYRDWKNAIGTFVKNIVAPPARRKGLTFRRKAIGVLRRSDLVRSNFIIRSSHSGHRKTIQMDPVQARQEFIDNMRESDAVLSVKGDGNYSVRFYEALSMGRVPLFIDTECVLPLEDVIRYDEFIIRVDHTEIGKIDRIAAERFLSMTADDVAAMQKKARGAFESYLRIDRFLAHEIARLKL